MTAYVLERAWIEGAMHDDVVVEIEGGRFTSVEVPALSRGLSTVATGENPGNHRVPGDCHRGQATPTPTPTPTPVRGLVIPGLANTHSHAFHRALRGRTQRERGTFWTWRDQMYAVAGRLDPDTYLELARATYREMVAAGITSVGEFHYLHHRPDGTPYTDANAMGLALVQAARDAGLRITLLDTLYLSSGFGAAPEGVQVRYCDGSVARWAARVEELGEDDGVRIGAAVHSVRAVAAEDLDEVAGWVGDRPFHVHLSEQVAENVACLAAYGVSPTRLLADHGLLRPTSSLVHATHLHESDVALIGRARAFAAFCPTTERDLGDGVGPSRALHTAGARLTLGSDSHAVIDPFEEMRGLEMNERIVTQQRGHWTAAELIEAATVTGHESLGWSDTGRIAVGQRADLVVLDPSSTRTAGTGRDEGTVAFAATSGDVSDVMVDGRWVLKAGDRAQIGRDLDEAIGRLWT